MRRRKTTKRRAARQSSRPRSGVRPAEHRIVTTFSKVTPLEDGSDYPYEEKHGWIDEEGTVIEQDSSGSYVEDAVRFLRKEGAIYVSSTAFHKGVWYSTEPTMNFRTGEVENHSMHLKGFTEAEERRICDELRQRKIVMENPAARDYFAVDATGTKIGGPYRNYDEAKREAEKANGYVEYAFEGTAREALARDFSTAHAMLDAAKSQGFTHYTVPAGQDWQFPTEYTLYKKEERQGLDSEWHATKAFVAEGKWHIARGYRVVANPETLPGYRRIEEKGNGPRPHLRDNPTRTHGGGSSSDYGEIRVGSRVTIVDRFGVEHTGRAVMLGPAGWVLNMGGRHGTPALASLTNFVRVSGGGRMDRRFDARENPLTMIRGEGKRRNYDRFTQAYLDAALWSSIDDQDEPLDEHYSVADFAPATRDAMLADAERFQAEHYEDIQENLARAGTDFWLTRNGHGAGFWDGDWPEAVGERLTKAAKAYGEFQLYVGDDGMIYAMGHERPAHLRRVKDGRAGEPVPVVYERGVGKPLEAREDLEDVEIEPIEQGGCVPWIKVTRDPEKYESCLAKAKKIGPVDTPEKVFDLLRGTYEQEDQEVFLVVLTDIRGQLRGVAEVARGQRSRVSVDTADIIRIVALSGAEGFTVAHNHPSGSPKPSKSDKDLTKAITEATSALNGGKGMSGVTFLDHVVCGTKKYHSLREHDPGLFR